MIADEELYKLLKACRKGERRSQDELYSNFYSYAISVCLRYSKTREEAVEILNDGFVKVFSRMDQYTRGFSFKSWLRRIMVNSAIDYYRRNEKHYHNVDISYARDEGISETALDSMSAEEILDSVRNLPPSYRTVFNLFAIEGFRHEEIAEMLGISVGTSKSNLAVARSKLKRDLLGKADRLKKHG